MEIQLYIDNKGTFNLYIINYYFKLYLLTPLILFTLTLAILNDFSIAKPPLLINITAPFINIIAPFIDIMAPLFINIIVLFINITAPLINATASFIKAIAAINYSKDLVTLVKMYTKESKYSKKDDNFNYKFIIFNNLYNRVSIPQKAKIKGFLIML